MSNGCWFVFVMEATQWGRLGCLVLQRIVRKPQAASFKHAARGNYSITLNSWATNYSPVFQQFEQLFFTSTQSPGCDQRQQIEVDCLSNVII